MEGTRQDQRGKSDPLLKPIYNVKNISENQKLKNMEYKTKPFKELVSPEQYGNAKTHWSKLMDGQISGRFDMTFYVTDNGAYDACNSNICGTCACSAGYLIETLQLPLGEVKALKDSLGGMEHIIFPVVIFRIISDLKLGLGKLYNPDAYAWCFDSAWSDVDNSPRGAGIRMRILYENGLPENMYAQMGGKAQLMYKEELIADKNNVISTLKKFYAIPDAGKTMYAVFNAKHEFAGSVYPSEPLKPYLKWLFYPNTTYNTGVFHFTATELMDLTCILSQVKEIYIKKHLNTDYAEDFGTSED